MCPFSSPRSVDSARSPATSSVLTDMLVIGLGGLLSLTAPVALATTPHPAPATATQSGAAPTGDAHREYGLQELIDLALGENRLVQAARSDADMARAGVTTADAFPNPELTYTTGDSRARIPGAATGRVQTLEISQPLEYPQLRQARVGAAEALAQAAESGRRGVELDTVAQIRRRFYDLLRREAEVRTAQDFQQLAEAIRGRIALRFDQGDAARYELFKADAEYLNAQKAVQTARLRLRQSEAALRQAVGAPLARTFSLRGSLPRQVELPDPQRLREEILSNNPELTRQRAQVSRAEQSLSLEEARRLPALSLKASRETDAELNTTKAGFAITLPLWDRRKGPVAEARADLMRARHQLEAENFALAQRLDEAVALLEMANTQVIALEGGIVAQAEAALRVAEAAYRFGERGILEVLDAQRVYRAARGELISARYDLAEALVEIDRLIASQPGGSPDPQLRPIARSADDDGTTPVNLPPTPTSAPLSPDFPRN